MTPLLPFHTVLAHEASPNSKRPPLDPEGLCNAVILSRPGARFLDRWLMEYERFDEASWAEFSVRKPWEIARRPEAKGEVTVLGERAFFWPLWEGSGEESRIRYVRRPLLAPVGPFLPLSFPRADRDSAPRRLASRSTRTTSTTSSPRASSRTTPGSHSLRSTSMRLRQRRSGRASRALIGSSSGASPFQLCSTWAERDTDI